MPPSELAQPSDNRRNGADRRQRSGDALAFEDRRRGPRRRAELPRAPWPSLVFAGLLGVLSALAAQGTLAASPHAGRALRPVLSGATAIAAPDLDATRACLRANALRDHAEALTPAGVLSDEASIEHWLDVAGELELRLTRGVGIGRCEREAIRATNAALVRVGVLRPST